MFRGQNEKKCSNVRAYVVGKYNVKTYEKQKLTSEHPRIATLLISEHFFEKQDRGKPRDFLHSIRYGARGSGRMPQKFLMVLREVFQVR